MIVLYFMQRPLYDPVWYIRCYDEDQIFIKDWYEWWTTFRPSENVWIVPGTIEE